MEKLTRSESYSFLGDIYTKDQMIHIAVLLQVHIMKSVSTLRLKITKKSMTDQPQNTYCKMISLKLYLVKCTLVEK